VALVGPAVAVGSPEDPFELVDVTAPLVVLPDVFMAFAALAMLPRTFCEVGDVSCAGASPGLLMGYPVKIDAGLGEVSRVFPESPPLEPESLLMTPRLLGLWLWP
jgi:hypothetical protein